MFDEAQDQPVKPLSDLLTDENFVAAPIDDKERMVKARFGEYANSYTSDQEREQLFKTQSDTLSALHKDNYWGVLRDSLAPELRTKENLEALHKDVQQYDLERSDPSFDPEKFSPKSYVPLSDSQIDEAVLAIRNGKGSPYHYAPSDAEKIKARYVESGGNNPIAEIMLGNEAAGITGVSDGAMANGSSQRFSDTVQPLLKPLDALKKIEDERHQTIWKPLSDRDGYMAKFRRKPDPTGHIWEVETPGGVVAKTFDETPNDHQLTDFIRENLDLFGPDDQQRIEKDGALTLRWRL